MASGAHDLDAHLQLRTGERSLTGTLRIGPNPPSGQVDEPALRAYLTSRGVAGRAVDGPALAGLAASAAAQPADEHAAVVARGVEPRDGARRVIEWVPQIARRIDEINARKEALADPDAPGARHAAIKGVEPVDHSGFSAFIFVQAGDLLATIAPPDAGEDGEDIFGAVIPARQPSEPADLDPEAIRLTADNRLIALTRGRLVYWGHQQTIERTLRVDGDVGFSTGNIDFPGPIEVGGGVKDRMSVRGLGTVTVQRLVEAACIESARDIVLERGIAGREIAVLTAGRGIRAGYMEAVEAVTGGDCSVKHEITNCAITAGGSISIPAGAIRGGVVNAAMGVEASVLGSTQEVRTEVLIASIPELEALLAQARERAVEAQGQLLPKMDRLAAFAASVGRPTPAQIEQRMSLEFDVAECRRRLAELEAAVARIEVNRAVRTRVRMWVGQRIHAGVVVWLPGHRATFRGELRGESVIRLDGAGHLVVDHKGATRPLGDFARVEPDARIAAMTRPAGAGQGGEAEEAAAA